MFFSFTAMFCNGIMNKKDKGGFFVNKKLTVAVIGCGDFAKNFVPLFKEHPYVEKVYVCDLIKEKALEYSEKFEVEIIPTFEDALSDVTLLELSSLPLSNCVSSLFVGRSLSLVTSPLVMPELRAAH